MLNDLLELAGFVLVVGFCVVVWWPSALLVAGLGLIVAATIRDRARRRPLTELERRRLREAS